MNQRTRRLLLLSLALGLVMPALPARAATPDEVKTAIKKGVEFLYKAQNADGSWEVVPAPTTDGAHEVTGKQWGGLTAMATYSLLAAGENEQHPKIAKAVAWLGKANIVGTYALGLRSQCWPLLDADGPYGKIIRAGVKKDAAALLAYAYSGEGESMGFYTYFRDTYKSATMPVGTGPYDRSNSQYGVLGVWGCEQAGGEIPAKYWMVQDNIWKKSQNADGGWEYTGEGPSTHTMAAAGLATLFITQDYLINSAMGKRECKGNYVNKHIDLGLGYMDKNAKAMLTEQGGPFYHYLMYGIERIGVASGRKYFGTLDWYQVGAEALVRQQGGDGAWGADEMVFNAKKVPSTVFCLMFLVRGRAPVVMNKLEYASVAKEGTGDCWNQRPRDAANFAWWMGKQAERFYNWQIVNLKVDPDELFDAPLLYIAGSESLGFKKEEVEKLKRYVEDGGIILGHADCDKERFSKSFRDLGKQMFPGYEFRAMPVNHPIYTRQQFNVNRWKSRPVVYELSNGVRSLMILLPKGDPGRKWQARGGKDDEAFQLGANLYYYATDKNLDKFKGITHIVKPSGSKAPAAAAVKVARIEYAGNWNPEPAGWRRLGVILGNDHQLGVATVPVKLDGKALAATGATLAHLTGTTKFVLSDAQRKELKAFVQGGGTLVVDAAGGVTEFADAAEKELAATFGDAAGKALTSSLPVGHAVFTQAGAQIKDFKYRAFTKPSISGKVPRLKGIEVGGRTAVLFSREDLTAGMVGQDVDGVFGYAPAVATAIMRNIVLFATGGRPAPAAPGDAVAVAPENGGANAGAGDAAADPAPPKGDELAAAEPDAPPANADDAAKGEAAPAPATRPSKPPEEITGDIDVGAELADKDSDENAGKKSRSTKRKRVGKSE
jgi:hypothetical protein